MNRARRLEIADAAFTLLLLVTLTVEAAVTPPRRLVLSFATAIFVGLVVTFVLRLRAGERRGPVAVTIDFALLVSAFPLLPVSVAPFRAVRLVRLPLAWARGVRGLRAQLRRYGGWMVVIAAVGTNWIGALLIYEVERDAGIGTLGDAFWWAATTMTTVGYGDLAPRTVPGRLVAILLMVVGISIFGAITALFAAWLTTGDGDERAELARLRAEVEALRR